METLNEIETKIDFYDKIVLNKMLAVDLKRIFDRDKVIFVSNVNLEKYYLKNSIDNIGRMANDKMYKLILNRLNNIINDIKNQDNIIVLNKSYNEFIIGIFFKENDYIDLETIIKNILFENELEIDIDSLFLYNIKVKRID